jgi:hypothetical protein
LHYAYIEMMNRSRMVLGSLLIASAASACTGQLSEGTGDPGDDTMTPPPTTPPPTTLTDKQLISAWSGCMTQDNFNTAGMIAWGTMASQNGNACSSCHSDGFEGFFASSDKTAMFTAISTSSDFLLPFFAPDVPNQKMIVNTSIFALVGGQQGEYKDHTPFDPVNNPGEVALQKFYTATMGVQTAGGCGAATIPAM